MQIIKIGKSISNEIHEDFINDPTVSRVHCQIFVDDEGNKFLTDLNSTNGTFVNGNKITEPVQLGRFDIVRAGNSLVRWKEYLMEEENHNDIYDDNDEQIFEIKNDYQPKSKNHFWLILLFFVIIIFVARECNQNSDYTSDKKEDIIEKPTKKNEVKPKDTYNYTPPIIKNKPVLSPTLRPSNGFSPYNSYYGKGVYNNSTNNTIKVTAPLRQDIVIMIKDVYSGKTIRNEYIRSGSVFSLTGIPFGSYKFIYLYGNDWSAEADFKSGLAKGNFLTDKGVGKSSKFYDVEFEVGYYGTYSLTLQLLSNGNLTTIEGSENDL